MRRHLPIPRPRREALAGVAAAVAAESAGAPRDDNQRGDGSVASPAGSTAAVAGQPPIQHAPEATSAPRWRELLFAPRRCRPKSTLRLESRRRSLSPAFSLPAPSAGI